MAVAPSSDHRLDRTLTALADPTRRAIVERLARGETRVTDLAAPFAISLNAVSKHIKLLERAGLVRRRRVGREHRLRLTPEPLARVETWITTRASFWRASLAAIDTLLNDEARDASR